MQPPKLPWLVLSLCAHTHTYPHAFFLMYVSTIKMSLPKHEDLYLSEEDETHELAMLVDHL